MPAASGNKRSRSGAKKEKENDVEVEVKADAQEADDVDEFQGIRNGQGLPPAKRSKNDDGLPEFAQGKLTHWKDEVKRLKNQFAKIKAELDKANERIVFWENEEKERAHKMVPADVYTDDSYKRALEAFNKRREEGN